MSNTLEYKDYNGSVEFSAEDRVFHGSIVGIRDKVTFEGQSVQELELSFRGAVEEYLQFCEEQGKQPEIPYKGTFNVRVSTDLHKRAALRAQQRHIKLNRVVTEALEEYLLEA